MANAGSRTSGGAGRLRIARSRGAASGIVLIILGLWGALIAFVGPIFDFAYNADQGAAWSAARGWLEVLPGAVTVIGGLLLLRSRNRATAMLGGWLSVVAGAWFVVGRVVAATLTIGEIGAPVAQTDAKAAWLELTYFYGLGAAIVFFGATALGRLSVRSVRDVDYAEREVLRTSDSESIPVVTADDAVEERPRRGWRRAFRHREEERNVDTPAAV